MLTSTYGIKAFPTFGASALDTTKSNIVGMVNDAFNGLVSKFRTTPVVTGNEIYAQQAWMKIQEANALLVLAYGGTAIANGH